MAPLAEAFVRIRADTSGIRRDVDRDFRGAGDGAGRSFGDGFGRSGEGSIRQSLRRFAAGLSGGGGFGGAGSRSGREWGDGFTRDAQGRLHDAQGRFTRDLSRMNGRINVDIDTSGVLAGVQILGLAIGGLAAIPVAATLGAGVLALVPAFAAAGIGAAGLAAVAIPAITSIKAALQAQEQAQQQAGAAAGQAQARALAQAGAQQQLASAVRNAGFAHRQALDQVRSAEQQLASAQAGALSAQRALNAARLDAKRQLADMANQVADAQLQVRQSTFDVADAQTAYNKVLADPKATNDQKARARLALDQAKQQLTEQQQMLKRLQEEEKAAAKAGVDGSDQVRQAREALAQANQQVVDSERALSTARAGVARADQQSADAVAAARRALTSASMSGASANSALDASMAKLSPSARTLMGQWKGLKTAFTGWAQSLEPTVLPLFGRGINLVKSALPGFTPVVKGAAGAVDGLITDVAKAAKGGFWGQFRKNLTALVPTAITGFGKATGNVATGMAGIINAFIPYAPALLAWIVRITGGFAKWGKGLAGSNGVSTFMNFVKVNGPQVWKTAQEIAVAVMHIVTSLSGLGVGALGGIGLLARAVNGMSPGQIQAVAIAFLAVRAAILGVTLAQNAIRIATAAWAAVQWALNAALNANPIGLIVIAIAALVAGVIYAYTHFTWFKNAVNAAWRGIATASSWAWNTVIKPIFNLLKSYIVNIVVPYFEFLWRIAKVVFQGVAGYVSFMWNNVVKPVFNLLKSYIVNIVVPYFQLLWKIAKTAFSGIGSVVSSMWSNVVRPAFNALKSGVSAVGNSFQSAVKFIGKVWGGLQDVAKRPVAFVVNTVYNNGIRKAWNVIADLVHLPQLPPLKFATGGVLPGYTPGKDIYTAPAYAFSGGEAILRPELTRALGEGWVKSGNKAAITGGVGGATKFLAGAGDPGGVLAGFAGGGIIGTIKGAVGGAKNLIVKGASSILDKGASFAAHRILDPVLGQINKMANDSRWAQAMTALPRQMVNGFLGWIKSKVDPKIGGGVGNAAAVRAARSQIGLPYTWGGGGLGGPSRGFAQGAGTIGFDCSSLMEYAWGKASGGRDITRTTYSQRQFLRGIPRPVPGAVGQPHPGHTYMYAGNGRVIEAAHTGTNIREASARGGEWWGLPPASWKLDSGGVLPAKSRGVWENDTVHDEQVLTGPTASRIEEMLAGGHLGSGVTFTGDVHLHDGVDIDLLSSRLGFAARSTDFG